MEKKTGVNVLTTNDIREHARDWTLAGDVGLLAHLEQFSENLISKTQETQKNFNELVDDYEELHTKVGNITNQFLALQNCQFVENRVYDEETPTEEKPEVKAPNKEDQEKLLLMQYKKAVEVGIKLLDTHFHEVQLPPNSDSDEEDELSPGNSFIWKAKNPYSSKKFPFLIGSSEWWADDQVGLGPADDVLETEKINSESESDVESLKSVEKTTKLSSSSSMENIKSGAGKPGFMESSEDLFGFEKNESLKNNAFDEFSKGSTNSFPEGPANFQPDLEREAEQEARNRGGGDLSSERREQVEVKSSQNEIPTDKPAKVDNEFTRELMAKLVSVTNKAEKKGEKKKEEEEEKEKTEEVLPPAKVKTEESLFDETDEGSDLFSGTEAKPSEGERSRRGLSFLDGEIDDELFKGEKDLFSGKSLFENAEGRPPQKNNSDESETSPKKEGSKKNFVGNLFDDSDDNHDDYDDAALFAAGPANSKSAAKSPPPMETGGQKDLASDFDWDKEEEGLFQEARNDVDDLFNSTGLFDEKVVGESKSEEATPGLFAESDPVMKPGNSPKGGSVFGSGPGKDSVDDPFGFSSSTSTTGKESRLTKISILDSDDEEDLFSKGFEREGRKVLGRGTSGGVEDDDDETSLFADKPKPSDAVSVSSSRSSLFDDASVSKSRLASVFEKDRSGKMEGEPMEDSLFSGGGRPGRDLFSGKRKGGERSSLFGDFDDDDGDDLFGPGKKASGKSPGESVGVEKEEVPGVRSSIDVLGGEDLFKGGETSRTSNLRGTKSDIFRHSEKSLFADDSELFSDSGEGAGAKPKPPSSLSLKGKATEDKSQSVGKLNIPDNLKVKFESAAKHISPGGLTKPPAEERKEREEGDLEEPIQPSALLKCPSKDRVKIPGRRRPQSRRARQEAIRNSGAWDQPISPSAGANVSQPPKDPLPSPAVSNPLSPSTDEEDFFKVPELDTNFEKEDQSIFKSDLFESSKTLKLDDSLLFDGAPVLSPLTPKKGVEPEGERKEPENPANSLFGSVKSKVRSIFDDDYDDDDYDFNDEENLFKTPKSNPGDSVLTQKSEGKVKKPLFGSGIDDEDDDEDDLFGGKGHVTPKLPPVDKLKEGGEPRNKGSSDFVDPLGLMTRNE